MKKKRETKNGQAASKIKKWKFEDEMSFLLPFIQERDTCSNLKDASDDDNESKPNENEYNDKNDDTTNDRNDDIDDEIDDRDGRNDNKDDDKDNDVDEMESHTEDEKKKKQNEINRKMITNVAKSKRNRCQTQPETASAVVMKYLLDKKTAKTQIAPRTQQPDATDMFFSSIAATVKTFSPYYQNIAKSQIFSIITDHEMKQITQQQPFFAPNTSTQYKDPASMQSYQTRPYQYNVSRLLPSQSTSSTISAPYPSPSEIATPIPSSSHDDLPATIPMSHLNEETAYINI